jgi:hypothetical protein
VGIRSSLLGLPNNSSLSIHVLVLERLDNGGYRYKITIEKSSSASSESISIDHDATKGDVEAVVVNLTIQNA